MQKRVQPVFTLSGVLSWQQEGWGEIQWAPLPKGLGIGPLCHTLEKGRAQAWEAWHPHLADGPGQCL